MNSRERFQATMSFNKPDRVPYFEEGIREEVLLAWRAQGLSPQADLAEMFHTDQREEIDLDLWPRPEPPRWPVSQTDLVDFRRRLDPDDPARWPVDWQDRVRAWRDRSHVLMLRLQDGFFLTMGVGDWERFYEVMHLVKDDPVFVRNLLDVHAEFNTRLAERVLNEVQVDAVIFSEPIGGMHGPLIAPWTYQELVLASYQPLFQLIQEHAIQTVILRTYANARVLIPILLKAGVNCLWACECETGAMDYHAIRKEFGRDLRLVGGIDLDALRYGQESIRREVLEQVPPLLESGGYIPLADGRVRPDVPLADYIFYRRLLEQVASQTGDT
jgi:hypothetical protein